MKREVIAITLLLSIIFAEYFVKSYLEIDLYFQGLHLIDIQDETQQLKVKNTALEDELLSKSSYLYILQEAKKQGFLPAQFISL